MIRNTQELQGAWAKQIEEFEQAVQDFLAQKISDAKFQRMRLQNGVYGQRQDGVQMIRIKIPYGGLSAEQFERIADVCEKYSKGVAHITTRQDIQIHFVQVTNAPALMRDLGEVGITTREACGNTVRNVTACPYAGCAADEPFDVTPYAQAFAYHMLWNPICQNMSRKFKVAFEGCHEDHARIRIHDIGLQARIQDGKRGFKVYVAGSLGSSPMTGHLFYEFMPVEEMIPFAESILRVFDRYGERKTRSKARMKFVVKTLGFEKFKELVDAERAALKVDPAWNDYLKTISDSEQSEREGEARRGPLAEGATQAPIIAETPDYLEWKQSNVRPQGQDGYSMVDIRLPLGDMVPDQMRPLAGLLRQYANGKIRMTIEQNMVVRWVRNEDLPSFYQELKKLKMHHAGVDSVYDILACPGTDTCRLGIAGSRPLASVLEERLQAENGKISELAKDIHIKISGCPNSCGQHHLGQIGFHGAALPQKGHVVPAFQLHLGGGATPDKTTIGQIVMKIPSKNVPEATVRLITHYAEQRRDGEEFNAFYARIGREATQELLHEFEQVKTHEEDPEFYVDWGDKEEFGLQKGVVGECAGSPVSDVVPVLADAEAPLEQARALSKHGEHDAAMAKAYEAIAKAADVLLYTKMVQTFNSLESIQEFDNHFVRTGEFKELDGFRADMDSLIAAAPSEASAQALIEKAEAVFGHVRAK